MKPIKYAFLFLLILVSTVSTSCCRRSTDEVWDDTNSSCRHFSRGVCALGGKHGDSRQVCRPEEFYREPFSPYCETAFVPLQDEEGNDLICMENFPQTSAAPGEPGSSLPGIEAFQDPAADPMLSAIYENVHFPYNSDLVKGQQNLQRVRTIAQYMKRNPRTYVYIEGHCDERGPQAYNLALGTRRANAVRNMLIAEGVNPDNLFTVSYGKERPLDPGHDESAWARNRRAQFKVYGN